MKREILKITFKDTWGNPQMFIVGKYTDKIKERGEGSRLYYDVYLVNGEMRTIFTVEEVFWSALN